MRKSAISSLVFLFAAVTLTAQSVYPGLFEEKMSRHLAIPVRAESFLLSDVTLLPSRFRENMERDSAWMASISIDRLLHSFRTNAGLFAGREGGYFTVKKYGGWESLDCDLRGHTTGHLLSAYALMYASTGSELFRMKGDSIVATLAEVQDALGNGYLSAFPEKLIDRNISGTSVWAPWYTLHKLLSGLVDQYLYADNAEALRIAQGMGAWAYAKLSPLSEETRQKMIRNESGGINETFYNLYAITADDRYLWLARFFYNNDVIDPLKQQEGDMGTKHANTFIPKIIAETRNYELCGDVESKNIASFFWETMNSGHCFAPGCVSDREHFFPLDQFSDHISGYTGETCCTYNMLKLTRHLFCWTADPTLADWYERALYNHILGQQDPSSAMVSYFLPLKSGSHKVYSTPEQSFWCCVGSAFESHAKYGEAIYYHRADTLYVNLFIPSEVRWREQGITVRQETNFPQEESTRISIHIDSPRSATVCLRYPSWSGKATVKVNGSKIAVRQKPGGYIALHRKWHDGDVVEATFPMSIHVEYAYGNTDKAALLYGPIVLAGQRGTEGMQDPAPFSDPTKNNDYYTYDYHIPENLQTSLSIDANHPERSVVRNGEGLVFTTAEGDTLCPLYDTHRQRYVVYWDLK